MKPRQPNINEYFDQVSIYQESGVRDDTGGFTNTQTLVRSIWCSVRNHSKPLDDETEGKRVFARAIKVYCRKGLIGVTDLIQYNGEMYFVYNINNVNPAEDVVYAQIKQTS